MTAARLLQAHPEVVEPLRDGRLCLTTVVELSKALAADSGGGEVLARFFHASKREAKAVVAELVPDQAVPRRVVVTAVRASATTLALAPPPDSLQPVHLANHDADLGQPVHLANRLGAAPAPTAPAFIEDPKTAELSRIHVTVSRRLLKKLDAARAALSHSHPGAGEDEILEVGLDLIIERHAKRRGLVEKPRSKAKRSGVPHACAAPPRPVARQARAEPAEPVVRKREYVPTDVKRAVWTRDGGKCQWPVEGGGVCGSTLRVEIDHIVPAALGGPSTLANCRLTCDFHNDLAARQVFGDAHMDQFTKRGRPRTEAR